MTQESYKVTALQNRIYQLESDFNRMSTVKANAYESIQENIKTGEKEDSKTPNNEISAKIADTIISELLMETKDQKPPTAPHMIRIAGGESTEGETSSFIFYLLYFITQLCGLIMIALMGCLSVLYFGGFGPFSNPSTGFNWHPFLMTIGLIFLYGNSILIFRALRSTRKIILKIIHGSIHVIAFILTVFALMAVFDSHNFKNPPITNMYSIHSWLGLAAVVIFCLQYICGFIAYMEPGLAVKYKIAYMPVHIYFGLFDFILTIACALMGLTEKVFFSIENYSLFPRAGILANLCGIFYVIFGGLVVYLATETAYKRKPLPEDA